MCAPVHSRYLHPAKTITDNIWMFSLFFLDLGTTITTIVFLYRACAGHSGRDSVSSTVWQVIWASAVPPLVIMAIPIVNQFLVDSPIHPVTVFPVAMSGKFFVLSLMISVVGRGYIREKFDQLARGPLPQDNIFGLDISETVQSTVPTFAHRASLVYELETVRQSISQRSPRVTSTDAIQMGLHVKHPDEISHTETTSAYSDRNKSDSRQF
ncbi:hypothetical protein RhiLY_04773 [Ceratobasidium sp. AG-Ba]|nr:hypothetical protein RhiLY_04773 [Ceratobasidium sp. AG-Ba]